MDKAFIYDQRITFKGIPLAEKEGRKKKDHVRIIAMIPRDLNIRLRTHIATEHPEDTYGKLSEAVEQGLKMYLAQKS